MYQPDPLSCLNALADLDPGRDLAGHHTRYLHYDRAPPRPVYGDPVLVVLVLSTAQESRDEPTRKLLYLHDAAPDRAAVHVDVVYGEEGADPHGLATGYPGLVRLLDLRYKAVGRSVHYVRIRLQGSLWVPEEREGRSRGAEGQEAAPPPSGQQKRSASYERRQHVPAGRLPASLRYHRSSTSPGKGALQAKRNAGGTFTNETRRRTEAKWRSSSFCTK